MSFVYVWYDERTDFLVGCHDAIPISSYTCLVTWLSFRLYNAEGNITNVGSGYAP